MANRNVKPAAILDDSPYEVIPLARGLRLFAGLDTIHFFSIEAFIRQYDLPRGYVPPDKREDERKQVRDALNQYSVLVFDNSFERYDVVDPTHPYDGGIRGLSFLQGTVAPALELLQPDLRPLVICFAPSSRDVIDGARDELEQKGIIAFHKQEEAAYIGFYAAAVREYGLRFSYHEFVTSILGITENDMRYPNKGYRAGLTIKGDILYRGFDEDDNKQVSGAARLMPWNDVVNIFGSELNFTKKEFDMRVESVLRNHQIEGRTQGFIK